MLPLSTPATDYSPAAINITMDAYIELIDEASKLFGEEKYNMLLIPFTGSINLINGLVKSFASKIVHFKSDMTRSQIKVFHDKYIMNVRRALSAHYVDICEFDINVPSGMTGSYLEVAQGIKHFFDFTSVSLFELYKTRMNELFRALSVNNAINGFPVSPDMYSKGKIEFDREELFKNLVKHFDYKKEVVCKFKDKFKSIQEFQETDAILLSLDNVYTNINKVTTLIRDTTSTVDRIINYVKNCPVEKVVITEDFVKCFVEYVRSIAEAYDMFASVLEITTSVEHNFIKILETVYERV